MKAYQFYYQSFSWSPAEYIRVIASSESEATTLFNKHINECVGDCYFHSLSIRVINENNFLSHKHEIGDILGSNALI